MGRAKPGGRLVVLDGAEKGLGTSVSPSSSPRELAFYGWGVVAGVSAEVVAINGHALAPSQACDCHISLTSHHHPLLISQNSMHVADFAFLKPPRCARYTPTPPPTPSGTQ